MEDGDVLVYLDADEAIGHVAFVKTLVRIMLSRQDQNANFIGRILPHRQGEWTKRDVYETHCQGVNPYTDPWMQLEGGRFVIRKDAATVALIDSWAALAADYHLLSDEPSVQVSNGETRFFNEHRHDQSLLNVALACTSSKNGRASSARIVSGTPTPIDLCVETKRHVDEANATRTIWTSESKMLYCEISPYVNYSISLEG
jgi:hypothetical protein